MRMSVSGRGRVVVAPLRPRLDADAGGGAAVRMCACQTVPCKWQGCRFVLAPPADQRVGRLGRALLAAEEGVLPLLRLLDDEQVAQRILDLLRERVPRFSGELPELGGRSVPARRLLSMTPR